MSSAAVQGMVAAYTGAKTVSLARCAGQLRHTVDFANMFAAVSRCAAARVSGQPLEKLKLKRCIALRADDVATLCDYFDALRYVLLSQDVCQTYHPFFWLQVGLQVRTQPTPRLDWNAHAVLYMRLNDLLVLGLHCTVLQLVPCTMKTCLTPVMIRHTMNHDSCHDQPH